MFKQAKEMLKLVEENARKEEGAQKEASERAAEV
jgi:hypothetical protein